MEALGTEPSVREVKEYWDSHLNLTQFISEGSGRVGSDAFYCALEESLKKHDYKQRLLETFASGRKGQRLLEVGCGLGIELARLAKLGFQVTGIDLAPTAVKLCNQYLNRFDIVGTALVQNAQQMAFPDGTFDAVYSSGVLQHTPNINKAIREIWRVLRPGGRILIILYHRHSWFYLLHRLSGVNIEFESDDAPIINTYTKKELKRLFSGFTSVRIECEYYYPTPTGRRGVMPFLFNRLFVPVVRAIPRPFVREAGWHLVLTGRK